MLLGVTLEALQAALRMVLGAQVILGAQSLSPMGPSIELLEGSARNQREWPLEFLSTAWLLAPTPSHIPHIVHVFCCSNNKYGTLSIIE